MKVRFYRLISTYRENLALFSKNARLYLFGAFFASLGFSIFGLLFNLYLKDTGIKESVIGGIISAGSAATLITMLPAAHLIPRIHIKSILLFSGVMMLIGYIAQSTARNESMIIVGAFWAGLFSPLWQLSVAPFFMRNSSPRERPYLFSINFAISITAGIFGNLIGGFLPTVFTKIGIDTTKAYRLSLLSGVLLASISLVFFSKLTQDRVSEFEAHNKKPILVRIREYNWKLIFKLAFPVMLIGAGAGLIIPFLNLYFNKVFMSSSEQIGFYFAVLQVVMLIGTLVGPILAKKIGIAESIVLTEMLSIPFMFILAVTKNLNVALFAFLLRGALMNMSQPLLTNFEMESVRRWEQPITNSVISLGWTLAWTLSTYIGGKIIEKSGFGVPFYIAIALYFISSVIFWAMFGKGENKNSTCANG